MIAATVTGAPKSNSHASASAAAVVPKNSISVTTPERCGGLVFGILIFDPPARDRFYPLGCMMPLATSADTLRRVRTRHDTCVTMPLVSAQWQVSPGAREP